ncbi:hypothetical protein [Marimonas lutisalis]|uniref:hypothetical protein n=1 Tax=Marimonas lutisalis TaxID=2545756 RepID=UPI0010FA5BAC|nr:hypothetical protein [Marimonas lutisalis]
MRIAARRLISFLGLLVLNAQAALAYPETERLDVFFDAPWRTVRDYVPVLVFTPQISSPTALNPARLTEIQITAFDVRSRESVRILFHDRIDEADQTTCTGSDGSTHEVSIIDPDGHERQTLSPSEKTTDFWHYVVRIPTECLGIPGLDELPGVQHIRGVAIASNGDEFERVMRVVVEPNAGLPKFSPLDRHYDIHVHTIAEQTASKLNDVNSARKAFGGPIAMLVEAAYALGMLDVQLNAGNWSDFRNKIATTDHNAFFSGGDFDAGNAPGFGPTSTTDGKRGEFEWYRNHLGAMGGEEITLSGRGQVVASGVPRYGSHLLSYDAPHFEGPWHGGDIDMVDILSTELNFDLGSVGIDADDFEPHFHATGSHNPNDLRSVLAEMQRGGGFGYAAHPFSSIGGWHSDDFRFGLGYPPFRPADKSAIQVDASGREFIFKGSQVWNGKADFVTSASLKDDGLTSQAARQRDPFSGAQPEQLFVGRPNWDSDMKKTMARYYDHVRDGLAFSFQDSPNRRFIRKVYASAGTDAHGDFNYEISVPSTVLFFISEDFERAINGIPFLEFSFDPEQLSKNSNAFGRVRTYALASDKSLAPGEFVGASNQPGPFQPTAPPPQPLAGEHSNGGSQNDPNVLAYEEGNTVLTDGPICMFHLDANCRLNSSGDDLSWHDQRCEFENADGAIGGAGHFDGGRTALVPRDLENGVSGITAQTVWKGGNQYFYKANDSSSMAFTLNRIGGGRVFGFISPPSGEEGVKNQFDLGSLAVSNRNYRASALQLVGKRGRGIEKSYCITNPIWTAPYTISVINQPEKCPFEPGELKVSIKFGISMETSISDPCPEEGCHANPEFPNSYGGAQVSVQQLDASGNSAGQTISLSDRKWFANNLVQGGIIDDANLVATNTEMIACGPRGWDSEKRKRDSGKVSYAIYVTDLYDTNLNRLNNIGDTISVRSNMPSSQGQRPDAQDTPTEAQQPTPSGD